MIMENKIALIEVGDNCISEAKEVHRSLFAFGEKDDWYVFNSAELNVEQEIQDLLPFYAGVFIVRGETL